MNIKDILVSALINFETMTIAGVWQTFQNICGQFKSFKCVNVVFNAL